MAILTGGPIPGRGPEIPVFPGGPDLGGWQKSGGTWEIPFFGSPKRTPKNGHFEAMRGKIGVKNGPQNPGPRPPDFHRKIHLLESPCGTCRRPGPKSGFSGPPPEIGGPGKIDDFHTSE